MVDSHTRVEAMSTIESEKGQGGGGLLRLEELSYDGEPALELTYDGEPAVINYDLRKLTLLYMYMISVKFMQCCNCYRL